MYTLIITILSILAFIEINKRTIQLGSKRNFKGFPNFFWLILTVILSIRYAQGTDFVEYEAQYEFIDSNMSFFVNALYHGEIGWYILLLLFKKANISFDVFIIVISLVMMFSFKRAVTKYSPYPVLSMILFFPTYYLTYCQSAMRQGLVLCIFIGYGLPLLLNRRNIYYCMLIVGLMSIHTSAVALLLLPFVKSIKLKYEYIIVIILLISSFLSNILVVHVLHYVNDADGNKWMGIILRTLLLLLNVKLFKTIRMFDDQNDNMQLMTTLYNIYCCGYALFILLSASPLLSQRFTMPMKAVELFLFPLEIYLLKTQAGLLLSKDLKLRLSLNKLKLFALVFLILIANIETYKNISAYIDGYYREGVTPITYPIITIFNKEAVAVYKL